MKKILLIIGIIISISNSSFAEDINDGQTIRGTVGAQMYLKAGANWVEWQADVNTHHPYIVMMGKEISAGAERIIRTDNDGKIVIANPHPLFGTTQIFYNATGALTNFQITPAITAGWDIRVVQFSIISMDLVNKGEWKMCWNSTGTAEFSGGYLGTAPSGMGDLIYAINTGYTTLPGVWVTTSGACKIVIHYKTASTLMEY